MSEPDDVAPAGPATATANGVVMLTKNDEIVVAPRQAGSTRFANIDRPRTDFAPYARGPAVLQNHAYWISKNQLVRQRLNGTGPAEVLARDARPRTRVTAVLADGGRPVIGYISSINEEQPPQAKLWLEGRGSVNLTPEAAGGSSLALLRLGRDLLAVYIDARRSMTPVHARLLHFSNLGVKLDEDVVGAVLGAGVSLSEVFATTHAGEAWALFPTEQDISHFGLTLVRLGARPKVDSPTLVVPYPNGINVAPVTAASVCGKDYVFYARPANEKPRSPQELHVAAFDAATLGESEVIARAKAFSNLSVAPLPGGAALVYVADYRTWAITIHCKT